MFTLCYFNKNEWVRWDDLMKLEPNNLVCFQLPGCHEKDRTVQLYLVLQSMLLVQSILAGGC